jgi:hypothetical protein
MAIADQPVFISYSRKDYYFAESLAFHLLNRNVPVWLDVKDLNPGVDWEEDLDAAVAAAASVVLVGSHEAFKSVNVRSEYQRAAKLGKRIIVVRRRGLRLPEELKSREIVDFRGGFPQALDQLVASLTADQSKAAVTGTSHGINFVPRLPPWVAMIAATLAIPLLGYFALVIGAGDSQAGTYPFPIFVALYLAATFLLLWFFLLGFLDRRMGMTRLAVCLGCLVFVFAYPLFRLFYWGPSSLNGYDAGIIRLIVNHWATGALIGAVPLVGLAILLLTRPEDLLRWSPTGKVWGRYRIGRATKGSAEILDTATAFKRAKRFRLFYDTPDTPAAGRLRQELISIGSEEAQSQEAQSDDTEVTAVLLLTNRTRTLWLQQQADHLKGALLTVVASGISLPETCSWLWRREWIDFRRWNVNQPDSTRGLPRVPEAVTAHARYYGASLAVCIWSLADGCRRLGPARGLGAVGNSIDSGTCRGGHGRYRIILRDPGTWFGAATDFLGAICALDRTFCCHGDRVRPHYTAVLRRPQPPFVDSGCSCHCLSFRCARVSSTTPACY